MRGAGSMEMVKVLEVREEAGGIASILFSPEPSHRWSSLGPGQFIMVYIPGVDEVPMSVSYLDDDPFVMGITVQNIGEATASLCSLRPGDRIGVRGPYGKGFTLPDPDGTDTIIGVSGGVGAASVILFMEMAWRRGYRTVSLAGARDMRSLPFRERWESCSGEAEFSTDDGSLGHHGFVTELLEMRLSAMSPGEKERTRVVTCGPEPMMAAVKNLMESFSVSGEFSLERYMKCGLGLCDSCSMSGRRVCADGPVFPLEELSLMKEFGRSHRDRSGRLIPLKERIT